jgi:hypothetical protein
LETFFGTSDVNYILNNSTVSLQVGFYIAAAGCLSIGIGIYSYDVMLTKTPVWVYVLLLTTVLLSCCGFATYNITIGNDWASNNDFYTNAHHVSVVADQGWQATGLTLEPGDAVWMLYVPHTGLWTADKTQPEYTDASGGTGAAAISSNGSNAALPLPDVSRQALIGRIGQGQPFYIGDGVSFIAAQEGSLQLRMNQANSLLQRDAGKLNTLIFAYRYTSGMKITVNTVTISAAPEWQDTQVSYVDGDWLGISYVFGSGSWSNSDAIVASDGRNGFPPAWTFINAGNDAGTPLPPVRNGLIAQIGPDPAFYCGYSIIARNVGSTSSNGKDAHLFLKLNTPGLSSGSMRVTIVKTHPNTISTVQYV